MPRRLRPERRLGTLHRLKSFEELHDREAEADQRHRRPHPRHERALEAQTGADPREVAVRGRPHLESVWLHDLTSHRFDLQIAKLARPAGPPALWLLPLWGCP